MDEHRFCPICNHSTDGSCGHVRPRFPLVLLVLGVVLLLIPLAYGAVSNRRTAVATDAQGAKAASGRHAGEANPTYSLLPAHARSEVASAASPVEPQEVREAQEDEPIAYVGHGGFFDQNGDQISPTIEWVAETQRWYRKRLLDRLEPNQKAELVAFERRLAEGLTPEGQAELVVQQRSLDWLAAHSPQTVALERLRTKLNALKHRLSWRLPRRDDREPLQGLVPFKLDSKIEAKLGLAEFKIAGGTASLVTTNSGQAYIDECTAADVPIPPSIGVLDPAGTAGWKSLGFIPTAEQFIVGTPAEVRIFKSSKGMCIALPRYSDGTKTIVDLDGVICLSRTTSKVCFWDNQMSGSGFSFAAGTQIPIGLANLAVDPMGRYQAGGAELEGGSGGVCTDCHAGENPYIIHPLADLDPGAGTLLMGDLADPPLNLPTFAPNRYVPLVPASWPQNNLSHAEAFVPGVCVGCHRKPVAGGIAGRFPHLSVDLNGTPGFCKTVLKQAIQKTMPPGSPPGSEAGNSDVIDFQNWCKELPSTSPSDNGDPHLITTDGVHYDFQAAGEFTALRNSDTGFELQTRQTPVLTSFTPGANAYTGLASCVSLNTAAAVRVGRHRISYQPVPGVEGAERMQLRIDGRAVILPRGGLKLGGGNRIAALGGGIDIRLDDGTRVIITPNFWASEGYWYLNVEVLHTPAREGTMGNIFGTDWLPRAPSGTSFGPKPAGLAARHLVLNRAFADAWRVTKVTSLFDYAAGTSTANFTERSWPPPPGASCQTIRSNPWPGGKPRKPVKPMNPEEAQRLCRRIQDPAAFENCVFDMTATGNPALVDAYLLTLKVRALP